MDKNALRRELKQRRQAHVAALPPATMRLLFLRPPAPLAALIPGDAIVGLYHAQGSEAPAHGYARWLLENGRRLALPCFASNDAPMQFRTWSDPFDDTGLAKGPFGLMQPAADAAPLVPGALIVPLTGFTARGDRLGQGAGHYDRWLARHPGVLTIGLAWDCQLVGELPLEAHDVPLHAVVTPTRFYESGL